MGWYQGRVSKRNAMPIYILAVFRKKETVPPTWNRLSGKQGKDTKFADKPGSDALPVTATQDCHYSDATQRKTQAARLRHHRHHDIIQSR